MPKPSAPLDSPDFFSPQVIAARRFYLDLACDNRKRLSVASGGFEQCSPDYRIDRAEFPHLCVEYVQSGRGSIRLGGQSCEIEAGFVFTYGPGVPHVIEADPSDPPRKYFIDFGGRDALPLLRRCNLAPGSVRRIAATADMRQLFDDFVFDGAHGGPLAGELCAALLEYMLLRIAASLVPSERQPTPAYGTYQKCRDYIERHHVRLRSLHEVAKETHVDQAYLCRLFQRYDMQTPHQLLTRLKMNRAAELLRDPQLLVKQVAAALGYADPFHFSRNFKNVYGASPNAFRRYRS